VQEDDGLAFAAATRTQFGGNPRPVFRLCQRRDPDDLQTVADRNF
jgi:hypothetical protein